MKTRGFALALCLTLLLSAFAGCRKGATSSQTVSTPTDNPAPVQKAQLVIALNPILQFEDGGPVVAYNDIKNAMKSDRETASLASMYNDTAWRWAYRHAEDWKMRATQTLAGWRNGKGASPQQALSAYAFSEDGTISVMAYAAGAMDLTAYPDAAVPDMGILLSVSGSEEEALCYTVPTDGSMNIPAGTIAAVESVAGVKTGFLAEDGTARRAAVRLIVNSRELWSGQFMNSTAAADGVAVTALSYPALEDIPVSAGDLVFISVTLDAEINQGDDITEPTDGGNGTEKPRATRHRSTAAAKPATTTQGKTRATSAGTTATTAPSTPPADEPKRISFLDDFDSRFMIICGADVSAEQLRLIADLRSRMEKTLATEQLFKTDEYADAGGYEILVGKTNRPESAAVLKELTDARTNHAADYILRMVGKKLVIAADSDFAMSLAIEHFLDTYCKDDKAAVPDNLNDVHRPAMQTVMLGTNNIASFTIQTEKYPSYMTVSAAQDLQRQVMLQTGYRLPIGTDVKPAAHTIQVGPVSSGRDQPKTLLANQNDYQITLKGSRLAIEGGSTYAANAGVQVLLTELKTKTTLPDGYSKTGTHHVGDHSLSGGYGLTWNDEFNGTAMTKKWMVNTDTSQSFDGSPQIRNGIFGEDFFLRNGCLVEVTRKKQGGPGYHAVRLTTQNLMNYRYGFLELRLIMGTNNGACSAIWMAGDGLNQQVMPEIDINENYGKDAYYPNLHIWPKNGEHEMLMGGANAKWVYPAEGEHFYDTFHYLGMEWTADYIAFYLDGQITEMVDITSSKYDAFRQSIILKLANGVGTPGYGFTDPDDCLADLNDFYEEQIIDFVRIYQKDDGVSRMRSRG